MNTFFFLNPISDKILPFPLILKTKQNIFAFGVAVITVINLKLDKVNLLVCVCVMSLRTLTKSRPYCGDEIND